MNFFIKAYDEALSLWSNSKSLLSNFYRPIFNKIFFSFVLLLNISLWLFSYFIYNNLTQDRLILHYNTDIGIDLIGDRHDVFIIPIISLFLIVVNKLFLLFIFRKKFSDFKFVFYFNSLFLLITQIFLFLAVLVIYLINFR